jgi:hypothetical protein
MELYCPIMTSVILIGQLQNASSGNDLNAVYYKIDRDRIVVCRVLDMRQHPDRIRQSLK